MVTGFDNIIVTQDDNSKKELSAERITLTSRDTDYYCRYYYDNTVIIIIIIIVYIRF